MIKFYLKHHRGGGKVVLGFGPGSIRTLVSMATDSSHRLTMGKNIKYLLLPNHKAQSFHILCVAMYYGPLYKSCQPCPWGPYGLESQMLHTKFSINRPAGSGEEDF